MNCLVTWVSCFWSLPGFLRLWQASKLRWEMHPLSSPAGALGGPQASEVKGPRGALEVRMEPEPTVSPSLAFTLGPTSPSLLTPFKGPTLRH